ncbi:MAG: outer membrane lipoprotein-sorting protein [Candidatus Margulisiibacteriota bacterium]
MKKAIFMFLALFVFSGIVFADELQDVINKIQANQNKIQDLSADIHLIMDMSVNAPSTGEGMETKIEQTSKLLIKGLDKTRVEMDFPTKQISITNGDKSVTIDPETGEKTMKDLKAVQAKKGMPQGAESNPNINVEKIKEIFNLSVSQRGNNCIVTGKPKKKSVYLGKMEFVIDKSRWVPVQILVYGSDGELASQSDLSYENISDIWVPSGTTTSVITPMGKIVAEMQMKNIKINQGIGDESFQVD